jgi:hypothetical protein
MGVGARGAHRALLVVDAAGQLAACPPGQEYDPALWAAETLRQCDLLRDLFGPLPFRSLALEASWQTAEVLDLAQRSYDERDFSRTQELGQALYRAGCRNRDMLPHCLWSAEHARGCWLVDLVLGKDRGSAQ